MGCKCLPMPIDVVLCMELFRKRRNSDENDKYRFRQPYHHQQLDSHILGHWTVQITLCCITTIVTQLSCPAHTALSLQVLALHVWRHSPQL
jgi:hypothetical protein